MRPTRIGVLVLVAVVAGAIAYLVTRSSFSSLPTPTGYALLWLAVLAIAEFYLAMATRARLSRRPGTRPVEPLVVARLVALAKATSVVGALAAGAYAGYLIWVARVESAAADRDTRVAAFGVGLAVLMTLVALLLEWVCRVPKRDDDDDWPPPEEQGR